MRSCARRETLEEVGLSISEDDFAPLGGAVSLSPGVIAERLHFYHGLADPASAQTPTEDGSPAEERAQIHWMPLEDALAALDDGEICDVKTEIAIRRLAARKGLMR